MCIRDRDRKISISDGDDYFAYSIAGWWWDDDNGGWTDGKRLIRESEVRPFKYKFQEGVNQEIEKLFSDIESVLEKVTVV